MLNSPAYFAAPVTFARPSTRDTGIPIWVMGLPCSQNLLVGLRLRRASRGLHQCPNNGAASQFDLEGIVGVTLSVAQHQVGRVREAGLIGGLPAQRCFGGGIAPRLVRDAPERQAGLLDGASIELQRRRNGDECECVGEAIAKFEVGVI